MDVACSTLCFTKEPLSEALRHIAELEFSRIDLAIAPDSPHVTPTEVVEDPGAIIERIRQGPSLSVTALTAKLDRQGLEPLAQLEAMAHLAKQLMAPLVVVEAAPSGTPIDQEAARLTIWERTAAEHGVVLALTTKTSSLTEDPDVCVELCQRVPGLGICLDPSHFLVGLKQGRSYDQVLPFVRHAHLRDSGRRLDQIQVKVGRGEIEYGKIVNSLGRFDFKGALVVSIEDRIAVDMDVEAEVRKLRLLLESLI